MDVADLEAGRSRDRPPRSERRQAAPVGQPRQRVDLVHELGELAGAEELLMAATTGCTLMSDCGVMASTSWVVMRSRTTRSMRDRPMRTWFWMSSPIDRMPVGEVVLVVQAVAGLGLGQVQHVADGGQDLAAAEDVLIRCGQVELSPLRP